MGDDDQYAGELQIKTIFSLEKIDGMYLFSAGRFRAQLYPIFERDSWSLRFEQRGDTAWAAWSVSIGPIEVAMMEDTDPIPIPPSGES